MLSEGERVIKFMVFKKKEERSFWFGTKFEKSSNFFIFIYMEIYSIYQR